MRSFHTAVFACVVVSLVAIGSRPVAAQVRGGRTGAPPSAQTFDPMAGPVVTGAPFSADATTTVTQTLGDGTRIEETVAARFYRDSTGRVRREQTILGLDALNPSGPAQTVITIDTVAGDTMAYVLDPIARTARRVPRGSSAGGYLAGVTWVPLDVGRRVRVQDDVLPLPLLLDQLLLSSNQNLARAQRGVPGDVRPVEEQLGTRQFDGVKATGRRTTTIIPLGRVGNDRPIQIVDEQWESPELGIVVYSRYSDPRTAVVEYQLTNIGRAEPRADLFVVPPDYTIIGAGQPGIRGNAPGAQRQGGARTPQ